MSVHRKKRSRWGDGNSWNEAHPTDRGWTSRWSSCSRFGRSTAWFSFFFFFFFVFFTTFIGTKNRQRQKVQRQWCNRSEGEWGSPNWSWMDRDSSAGRSCVAVCPDLGSKRAPTTIGSIRPRGCRTPRLCGDFDCCRFASMRIAGTEKWTGVPQASDRADSFPVEFRNGCFFWFKVFLKFLSFWLIIIITIWYNF